MTIDIQAIISQMTLEEKAAVCTGASSWITTSIEHLGIPEMIVSDGPHGVRRVPNVHSMGMKSFACYLFSYSILSRLYLGCGVDEANGALLLQKNVLPSMWMCCLAPASNGYVQ